MSIVPVSCKLCGGHVDMEASEPCDDYPGNAFANWDASIWCRSCHTSLPGGRPRYKTRDEAKFAAIEKWNKLHAKEAQS